MASVRRVKAAAAGDGARFVVIGLLVVQTALLLESPSPRRGAVGESIRWLLGVTLALVVADVWLHVTRGAATTGSRRHALAVPWWLIVAGTLGFLAAAFRHAPARLAANAVGLVLVSVPVCWVVARRAGATRAALAAAALAVLVVYPVRVDLSAAPSTTPAASGASSFRWSVGWPLEEWVLGHEIDLAGTWPGGDAALTIPLAGPHSGPQQIVARANGYDLGPLEEREYDVLYATIPAAVLTASRSVRIELRSTGYDPGLRIVAQRWAGGATRRDRASSYFDGRTWHSGTFDDALGRPAGGVYVLELRRKAEP